jgi:hypothetical protein
VDFEGIREAVAAGAVNEPADRRRSEHLRSLKETGFACTYWTAALSLALSRDRAFSRMKPQRNTALGLLSY